MGTVQILSTGEKQALSPRRRALADRLCLGICYLERKRPIDPELAVFHQREQMQRLREAFLKVLGHGSQTVRTPTESSRSSPGEDSIHRNAPYKPAVVSIGS